MKIYTKTGDRGETALFGGERVPKDHVRVCAYGAVDELGAVLGWARSLLAQTLSESQGSDGAEVLESLLPRLGQIQSELFEVGTLLATPPGKKVASAGLSTADIQHLEAWIDEAESVLSPLRSFILAGGVPLASALHMARAVCRRAERKVVGLLRAEPESAEITVVYLNRLADLLFVWARFANHCLGHEDVPWQARKKSL